MLRNTINYFNIITWFLFFSGDFKALKQEFWVNFEESKVLPSTSKCFQMSRNWDAVTSARWRWGGCCAVFAIVMLLQLKSGWNFSVSRAQTHPSLWSPRAAPPLFNGGARAPHHRWGRAGCIHQHPCARARTPGRPEHRSELASVCVRCRDTDGSTLFLVA